MNKASSAAPLLTQHFEPLVRCESAALHFICKWLVFVRRHGEGGLVTVRVRRAAGARGLSSSTQSPYNHLLLLTFLLFNCRFPESLSASQISPINGLISRISVNLLSIMSGP